MAGSEMGGQQGCSHGKDSVTRISTASILAWCYLIGSTVLKSLRGRFQSAGGKLGLLVLTAHLGQLMSSLLSVLQKQPLCHTCNGMLHCC